jgi:hypothetical protein
MIRKTYGKESMSRTQKFQILPRTKKARKVKSKVKSILLIFFDIKGIFTNNSSRKAKQSIPRSTVIFYGDCVNIHSR